MARWLAVLLLVPLAGCGGEDGVTATDPADHPLSHLAQVRISIDGEEYAVWLASTSADRARGLMGITANEIAPLSDGTERGMLFDFTADILPAFWMRDTIIPLDLAYLAADGRITEIHDLLPLDETLVRAGVAVRYALELRAGTLASRGLAPGDVVVIPPGVSSGP